MIKLQNLVPQVYYNESRDFQLFGRIYDVIFNYLKNNTQGIHDLAVNINPNQTILELMCNTLGFKVKHDYNNLELSALCSIFLTCVKSKGSLRAIKLLLDMITSIQNSNFTSEIIEDYDGADLVILVPADITDWTLIRDVLEYIMPSGSSYILQSQALIKPDLIQDTFTPKDTIDSKASWDIVSSSILRINESSNGENQEKINYNVSKENPYTEIDKSHENNNLESMNSSILTIAPVEKGQDEETIQNDIIQKLYQATTKEATTKTKHGSRKSTSKK